MRPLILIFVTLISFSSLAHENSKKYNPYYVGRYTSIDTAPTLAQTDLLSVIVEVRFPLDVNTVGSAINRFLLNSGYKLADIKDSDPSLYILLDSVLPAVHRSIGPISIREGLSVLSGSSWELIVDPVHRLVSYELKSNYKFKAE